MTAFVPCFQNVSNYLNPSLHYMWSSLRQLHKVLMPGSIPLEILIYLAWVWPGHLGLKNKQTQNSRSDSNAPARLRTVGYGVEVVSSILMHVKCSEDYLARRRDTVNITVFVVTISTWL